MENKIVSTCVVVISIIIYILAIRKSFERNSIVYSSLVIAQPWIIWAFHKRRMKKVTNREIKEIKHSNNSL